jgi:hypothetical protein
MGELVLGERILRFEQLVANVALQIDRGHVYPYMTLELGSIRERVAAVLTRELLGRTRFVFVHHLNVLIERVLLGELTVAVATLEQFVVKRGWWR